MRSSMRRIAAAMALLSSAIACGAPTVQQSKAANGAPLLSAVDPGPPRELVALIYETGCKVLPKSDRGAASLLEYILPEGPQGTAGPEYRRQLFLLNANISVTVSGRALYVSVSAPPSTLKAALQIARELVLKPKLVDEQLQIARQKSVSQLRAQQQDARFLTDLAAQRHLYPGHPDAYSCLGRVSDLEGLGLAALQRDWQALIEPSHLFFGSVGPLPTEQVRALIDSTVLKDNKARYVASVPVATAKFRKPSSAGGTDVILLEQPGAQVNQVLYIRPQDVVPDSEEFATAELALELLGGGFTGRLQQELREKRGLTYGAGAAIYDTLPQYIGGSFAGAQNIGRLIQELPQVYQDFVAEQQTEERLGIAKQAMLTSFRESTELPLDSFLMALSARFYGRDPNAWRNRPEQWSKVSVAKLQQFIKQRMNAKPAYLVVVGDPLALRPALEKAGYAKDAIETVSADEL
jgi:zinc protease